MQSNWSEILAESPSSADDAGTRQATLEGSVCSPLVDLGVIKAPGADVSTFLQGQLSNDLDALADGHSQLAAYCSPKGRMLALFRVVRHGDDYLLLLPNELLPAALKRLRMFVLRSKVVLEASDSMAVGLAGPLAEEALRSEWPELPAEADQGVSGPRGLCVRLRSERPRYLLLAPAAEMPELWSALTAKLPTASPSLWQLLDIRDGLPQVFSATQESFIPQMANLDLINGLSFTKGCYPGQEIVARMHYLGNLKRRMYRFTMPDGAVPAPGSEVRDESGSLVGEVVRAAAGPDGVEGLAVLQIERALQGGLRIDGSAIETAQPPYPLTTP